MMEMDIDIFLEALKEGKTPSTRHSLDALNGILKAYHDSGQRDFSVTTIGRVSAERGGVGYQSIRATANKHYRDLIQAWAAKASTTMKKPLLTRSRSKQVPQDIRLLERIPDPAVRVLFGQIIAERNRYRNEVNILKSKAEIIIDKRPVRHFDASAEHTVELLPPLKGIVNDIELKALKFACGEDCVERNGWNVTAAGQVKNEFGVEVFPHGFMTGLRKLTREMPDE